MYLPIFCLLCSLVQRFLNSGKQLPAMMASWVSRTVVHSSALALTCLWSMILDTPCTRSPV